MGVLIVSKIIELGLWSWWQTTWHKWGAHWCLLATTMSCAPNDIAKNFPGTMNFGLHYSQGIYQTQQIGSPLFGYFKKLFKSLKIRLHVWLLRTDCEMKRNSDDCSVPLAWAQCRCFSCSFKLYQTQVRSMPVVTVCIWLLLLEVNAPFQSRFLDLRKKGR